MPAIWNALRRLGDALPKGIDSHLFLTRCFKKFFALQYYVANAGMPPEALEMMRFLAENWTNAGVKHSDEENFFDLKKRALKALGHLVERPERTLLVVTHGTFVCMLICCMMAGEEVSPQLFDRVHHFLFLKNTAISVCEYDKGKWQLVIWNDHAHLG